MSADTPNLQRLAFAVNGVEQTLLVNPAAVLLDVLRDQLNLTGTKRGCDQGSCGACTVLLDGVPVLSCLTFAMKCHSRNVETIESLAQNAGLTTLQQGLADSGGIQCGFCTPGMVMTLHAFLRDNPSPTESEIREAISGNLCRCTGYTKIVKAAVHAAAKGSG